jgi:hypothetical protein
MSEHKSNPKRKRNQADDFYEAMPGVMRDYYYRELDAENLTDREMDENVNASGQAEEVSRQAKMTAMITIALTILVAIAMAALFIKGINVIKSSAPVPSSTTSQY